MEIIIYDQQGNQVSLKDGNREVCIHFKDDEGNTIGAYGPLTRETFYEMFKNYNESIPPTRKFKANGDSEQLFRKK